VVVSDRKGLTNGADDSRNLSDFGYQIFFGEGLNAAAILLPGELNAWRERSKSRTPSDRSNTWICWPSGGWDMPSRFAALPKMPLVRDREKIGEMAQQPKVDH
jgi:hypothetical protein